MSLLILVLNLVDTDTNGFADVFVKDLKTGAVELISSAPDGSPGDWGSTFPSISGDGRYVAFTSVASNLVPNDINNHNDIFIHDRHLGTTEMVSTEDDLGSTNPVISTDGNYIAYVSNSYTIKLYNRTNKTNEKIVDTSTFPYPATIYNLFINDNGQLVGFTTETPLAENAYPYKNIYIYDHSTGLFETITVNSDGSQGGCYDLSSVNGSISGDGRHVTFWCGSGLDSTAEYVTSPVYIRDRQMGTTEQISLPGNGILPWSDCLSPVISNDGRFVAFKNAPRDEQKMYTTWHDVYVLDRETGEQETLGNECYGAPSQYSEYYPVDISLNGRYVSFPSHSDQLVTDDLNGFADIFVVDRASDLDGDNFGNFLDIEIDDCDDTNPSINPDATELTNNGIDENCNGMADDFDNDFDDYGASVDCDENDPAINPGADEICDGIDNNCDGQIDEGFDVDNDGFTVCQGDCNDNDPAINPGAAEIKHDGIDQDCNSYDLTIDITATYKPNKDRLTVDATSGLGATANLTLAGYGSMTYSGSNWSIIVEPAGGNPGNVTVSGVEGSESAPVQ